MQFMIQTSCLKYQKKLIPKKIYLEKLGLRKDISLLSTVALLFLLFDTFGAIVIVM